MIGSRAAKRYAKAVLLLATEAKLETVVYDDMQSVTATIFGSDELNEMLQSPVINSAIKKSALMEVFKNINASSVNLIETLKKYYGVAQDNLQSQ